MPPSFDAGGPFTGQQGFAWRGLRPLCTSQKRVEEARLPGSGRESPSDPEQRTSLVRSWKLLSRDCIAVMQPIKSWQRNNRSEEHTSELQSLRHLVCRLLLEK